VAHAVHPGQPPSLQRGSSAWQATGKLTIKNVTKEISFPFTATKQDNGYLFKGGFTINRRDFGVGEGSLSLADELMVKFSIATTLEKN
ncbi:MAG: YceI family protein, partial [Flammeovirgaceae bacterium]|nr:YceI family protein [Flammeovirgaceae bacterium]